ncbi:MAG: OmpA family protein [Gemmatimonadales bacterium]
MQARIPVALGIAVVLTAAACGGAPPPPPQPVGPDPDSLAEAQRVQDSIAAVAAAEQARQDSIARAQQRERVRREQARADSLAQVRQADQEVRLTLGTQRVHFDFDRSEIKPEFNEVLDRKIAIMAANPTLRILIVGHADERGSDEYNIALGNRRALSARQYMVDRGIAEDRIDVDTRGEAEPLVNESNEDAWALNRRDEFSVLTAAMLRRP